MKANRRVFPKPKPLDMLKQLAQFSVSQSFKANSRNTQFILRTGILLGTIALSMTGCSQVGLPSNSTVPSVNPISDSATAAVLTISIQPTRERNEQEQMIAALDAHLEKVLGQRVDFLHPENPEESVDMLVDGRVQAAYLGAVSYFEALERGAKVRPLVAPIDQHTDRPWYRACIIVPANSSIKSLADLKGKRVAFVNRSSTTGYLIPLAALRQQGIEPERDFDEVLFGETHDKTEALLGRNGVEAVFTNLASYTAAKRQGKLSGRDTRVLWQSSAIPHPPVVISEDLPPDLVDKLKEAFLTTPPGLPDLMGATTIGYTLVEAEDYQSIQSLRQELNLTTEVSQP